MQKRTIVEWTCLICGYTTIIKPVNERVCPACNTGPAAGWSALDQARADSLEGGE